MIDSAQTFDFLLKEFKTLTCEKQTEDCSLSLFSMEVEQNFQGFIDVSIIHDYGNYKIEKKLDKIALKRTI